MNNLYPGESQSYRDARNELLQAELDLRRQTADVAVLRQNLPLGGATQNDYVFDSAAGPVSLSELFAGGSNSLILYSLMYAPDGSPCPMCTAFLDGLNGNAPHIMQRSNMAVVARASSDVLQKFADDRGWDNLRMLSSGQNSYNSDYNGEVEDGSQIPMMNVFTKDGDTIHHFYGTEVFFAAPEEGQHSRHIDNMWGLWNVFDLLPEGRGDGWFPSLSYAD